MKSKTHHQKPSAVLGLRTGTKATVQLHYYATPKSNRELAGDFDWGRRSPGTRRLAKALSELTDRETGEIESLLIVQPRLAFMLAETELGGTK